MKGIDISVYQLNVDWQRIKSEGVEFAMVKASQGGKVASNNIDPFEDRGFVKNVNGASEVGIKCGAYHYLTGTTREEVLREADFFIRTLDKVRDKIVFPCAVDMEESRYTRQSRDYNARLLKIFCTAVSEAGYIPMIYTNRAFSTHFINMTMLKGIDVWFALYRKSGQNGDFPTDVDDITIWQWGTDRLDGIVGDVDMDICKKSYEEELTFKAGDIVRVKESAVYYFPGGVRIPSWVKGNRYRISRTKSNGVDIIRGGEKCVLLGANINDQGVAQGDIMSWISVNNIERA